MFFGRITLAAVQRLNYGFREGPASFAGRQMQFSRGEYAGCLHWGNGGEMKRRE